MKQPCNIVSLLLSFFSSAIESGAGFQLEYETSDVSKWTFRMGACGGDFTTLNGFLTSPSYPGIYPNGAECIYTISQPTGNIIVLTFLSMDIDKLHWDCRFSDRLEIRDGPSGDSPLLERLCGKDIPAPIKSSQNKLWMK